MSKWYGEALGHPRPAREVRVHEGWLLLLDSVMVTHREIKLLTWRVQSVVFLYGAGFLQGGNQPHQVLALASLPQNLWSNSMV